MFASVMIAFMDQMNGWDDVSNNFEQSSLLILQDTLSSAKEVKTN